MSVDFPESEYNALFDFYYSTNGPAWDPGTHSRTDDVPWQFENPVNPCTAQWEGLTCELFDGAYHIKEVHLDGYGLRGELPPSLYNLTHLAVLSLQNNSLSGNIPTALTYLQQLTEIDLDYNNLNGTIPDSIGNMVNLFTLNLGLNKLHGTIPNSLGNLADLIALNF